jgi:arabinose-5-phosphate isomerase
MQDVLNLEAKALEKAALSLNEQTEKQLSTIFKELIESGGNLVFSGVGKSGLVGMKLAATFSSLGLPAFFLHPTEALHGDLGRVQFRDSLVLISKSGNTEELLKLLPFFDIPKDRRVGLLGKLNSPLANEVGIVLDCTVEKEACLNNQAPTTSTTVAMAMGDAMAVLFEKISGLSKEKYAEYHPGGMLGKTLRMKVKDLMWPKSECPVLSPTASLKDVILEMTKIRVGACAILESDQLKGIIVEGDIRRYFAGDKNDLNVAATTLMNHNPITISENVLAYEALNIMEKRENPIGVLPVVKEGTFLGFIRLHDLFKEGFS